MTEEIIQCVACVIVNESGEWLIGKRLPSKIWGIPGGKVEKGESDEEALHREIDEEVGIKLNNFESIRTISVPNRTRPNSFYNVHLFTSNSWSGTIENREPEKCEGWIWCNTTKIPNPKLDLLTILSNENLIL